MMVGLLFMYNKMSFILHYYIIQWCKMLHYQLINTWIIFITTNNRGVIYWMNNMLIQLLYQNTVIKIWKSILLLKKMIFRLLIEIS